MFKFKDCKERCAKAEVLRAKRATGSRNLMVLKYLGMG